MDKVKFKTISIILIIIPTAVMFFSFKYPNLSKTTKILISIFYVATYVAVAIANKIRINKNRK